MSTMRVGTADIIKKNGRHVDKKKDLVAVEEPLEIRLGYGPEHKRLETTISVTMRTPGNDIELAVGFLFTEAIIEGYQQIISVKYCRNVSRPEEIGNVIRVELSSDVDINLKTLERHFYTTSSCGVCGKTSIEAVRLNCTTLSGKQRWTDRMIRNAPKLLREKQDVFTYTGGIHASGLYNTEGRLIMIREDVGRHNALDKLIGAGLMKKDITLSKSFILVSGRASFELVQKAAVAGIFLMAAVGAPSSLAVQLAEETGMTLLGFVKEDSFNIYCGDQRVLIEENENQD